MPDPGKLNSCRPDNRNTTIFFDPYEDQGPEGRKRPPVVGLVHELQHSSDFDQGIIDVETNPKAGVEKSEEKAVRTENIMRSFLGIDKRTTYRGKPIENP
jgi:hypothetical protein